jgi:hypothetical protein
MSVETYGSHFSSHAIPNSHPLGDITRSEAEALPDEDEIRPTVTSLVPACEFGCLEAKVASNQLSAKLASMSPI